LERGEFGLSAGRVQTKPDDKVTGRRARLSATEVVSELDDLPNMDLETPKNGGVERRGGGYRGSHRRDSLG
jgi:hypothetical protein